MSFELVGSVDDVAKGATISAEVDGIEIAVVHADDDNIYAVRDECSHAAIPLSEGDVEDGEIECYLHGSRFDLRTGRPLGLPATQPVAVYACRVDDDTVVVDVTGPLNSNTLDQEY